jgi:hypothetical protein
MHSSEKNKRKRTENKLKSENTDKQNTDQLDKAGHIQEEADKVVNFLLDDIVEVFDEEEELIDDIEEVTLDETCNDIDDNEAKEYTSKCENCDYAATASRRYATFQQLSRHKENCCKARLRKSGTVKTKCDICSYANKDKMIMKRHMRDLHDIITDSTSPPPKRKKDVPEVEIKNAVNMEVEEEEVVDLSSRFEEMEVDNAEQDSEEDLKIASAMMDEKIMNKQKQDNEKYESYKEKQSRKEMKKELAEEEKIEQSTTFNKKRKQNLKDQRKMINKKVKRVKSLKKDNQDIKAIPNIKPIPEHCKHLLLDGDVLYVVPGDGCCGPNSAAAFLFQDEVYGPPLRRQMNKFMAKHWHKRYSLITQCSAKHPFIRKLKQTEIKYTDPKELIKYLDESEEAKFMWTDSEDLAVIADMFQVRIKVITSFGDNDRSPTVNHIYPDISLKPFAELKGVDIDEMVLFHENDNHFNLVVNEKSDLAMKGSLSYRFNIGPLLMDEIKDKNEEQTEETIQNDPLQLVKLEKEIKMCRSDKDKIEKEYNSCERELRTKTEEVEKLKLEVKDLKEILRLKDDLQENDLNESVEEALVESNPSEANHATNLEQNKSKKENNNQMQRDKFNCTKCDFVGGTKIQVIKHVNMKHVDQIMEKQFNCCHCDFQANSKEQLRKHSNLKHSLQNQTVDGDIICNICGDRFREKWNLMRHRKNQHISFVAPCRNEMDGKCSYTAEMCWWNHNPVQNFPNQNAKCYLCSEAFKSKADMMIHRREHHAGSVKKCFKFAQNNCNFKNNSCWYIHEEEMDTDVIKEKENESNDKVEEESEAVFQKVSANLKPPIRKQKKQKID